AAPHPQRAVARRRRRRRARLGPYRPGCPGAVRRRPRGRRRAHRPRAGRRAAGAPGGDGRRAAPGVGARRAQPRRSLPRRRQRDRGEGRSMSQQTPTSRNSTFANISMVARREVRARFFTKSNLISRAILLAARVVGLFALDDCANRDDDGAADFTVAAESSAAELEPQLVAAGAATGTSLDIEVLSRDEAEPRLADDLDAFLGGDPARPEMLVEEQADQQLLALVTSAVQAHVLATQVTELGGDPQEFTEALAGASPQVASVAADE